MIRLEHVGKTYADGTVAVQQLDLDVERGALVTLVGPSGCGKSTTLKMVNRLIEPTSGTITLDGEDVTGVDPVALRRRIGYVIQQVGLFPHQTVRTNVATVASLLGWDRKRTTDRVDELLSVVGLEPAQYGERYPAQLSGGQQQRVGVARALVADPPVLLMDEPFGAVDPITRQRLQDELLRLQVELRKTIVFVTHDFDEAVKLGDRIAILNVGSEIVQYDTPEQILTNPASEFVSSFVGAGAALKQLSLTRVRDVQRSEAAYGRPGDDPATSVAKAREFGRKHIVVLDHKDRPQRWVTLDEALQKGFKDVRRDEHLEIVSLTSTLNDALDVMLTSNHGVVVVTGAGNRYEGVVRV